MPALTSLKQSVFKRFSKHILASMGIMFALFLVLSASILSPGVSYKFPFHAQCELHWTWAKTNCSTVHKLLRKQADKWQGPEGCAKGGEKCLYSVISDDEEELMLQHITPVKKYVDDLSFKFCGSACGKIKVDVERPKRSVKMMDRLVMLSASDDGCAVLGFSRSEAWYAVLDYGTNYCNMRNLADGSGLSSLPDFVEKTSDDVCTLFSSADCSKY